MSHGGRRLARSGPMMRPYYAPTNLAKLRFDYQRPSNERAAQVGCRRIESTRFVQLGMTGSKSHLGVARLRVFSTLSPHHSDPDTLRFCGAVAHRHTSINVGPRAQIISQYAERSSPEWSSPFPRGESRTTSTAPRGCDYFVEHDIFFRHSRKSSQCHHVLASVGARRELPPTRCNNDSISVPEVPHGVT